MKESLARAAVLGAGMSDNEASITALDAHAL